MTVRRSLIRPALLAAAIVAVASCADPSPMGVPTFERGGRWTGSTKKGASLVSCSQSYDSVTQVVGPAGGLIAVGHHYLWVDSAALADTVSITAVAPADTVRWVRFQPDGLQFRTNGAGWSAVLATTFSDCGVPTVDTLKIAQVTDSLKVIRFLGAPDSTWMRSTKKRGVNQIQYVAGVLHHFSQYAVSW
jgi:hypothetical protein